MAITSGPGSLLLCSASGENGGVGTRLSRRRETMIKYSFIVPIYNDADLAEEFCQEYARVFRAELKTEDISGYVELIFVNDGSRNNSAETLGRLPKSFPFVRVINLSRNFGQHIALSCGYRHARGQFVGS